MDGFMRLCMILQGMYDWKHDRREQAKAWFRKAQHQVEDMLARTPDSPVKPGFERKYRNYISPIFNAEAELYKAYPEIVDLEFKARSGRLEDQIALLKRVQGSLVEHGPIDEQWLWSRGDRKSVG